MDASRVAGPAGSSPHIMMAGDSRDLPAMARVFASLPRDAYGQVFIEIVSAVQVVPLAVPAGVSVSWLRRDHVDAESGHTFGSARGEAIERAVLAWAAEWIEPGCTCGEHSFYVWVGCALSPSVDRLHSALHTMLDTSAHWSPDHRSHG
jgi:NADPH-dependent ferric siderophore reductase